MNVPLPTQTRSVDVQGACTEHESFLPEGYGSISRAGFYVPEKILAIFKSIYTGVRMAFPPLWRSRTAQGAEQPSARQAGRAQENSNGIQGGPSFFDLPLLPTERLFHFLGTEEKIAVSTTCKTFRSHFHRRYYGICQPLIASDARGHVFTRFGIRCPTGKTPSHRQMEALITRIETIIRAMKGVLQAFPEVPPQEHTAEELVEQLPPARLHELLETAYRCNLYGIFARPAKVPTGVTLDEATKRIQAWLGTSEAREIKELHAHQSCISCIPAEIGSLESLQVLNLYGNWLAELPAELGHLSGLRALDLRGNPLGSSSAELWDVFPNLFILGLGSGFTGKMPGAAQERSYLWRVRASAARARAAFTRFAGKAVERGLVIRDTVRSWTLAAAKRTLSSVKFAGPAGR